MPNVRLIIFVTVAIFFLPACREASSPEAAEVRTGGAVDGQAGSTPTGAPSPAVDLAPASSPVPSAPTSAGDATPVPSEPVPVLPTETSYPLGMSTALPGFSSAEGDRAGWLFHGMGDSVPPLAFSPAGALLATGHGDGSIILWDLASGGRVRTLGSESNGGEVAAVAFSPDGNLLAAAQPGAGTIEVWLAATGDLMRRLEIRPGVSDLAFSGDGRFLAGAVGRGETREALGQVWVWNTESWTEEQVLGDVAPDIVFGQEGTLGTVSGVPLPAMGPTIEPGSVDFWDVVSGERRRQLGVDGYVAGMDYHSGKQMVAANVLRSIPREPGYASVTYLLDAESGQLLHSLPAPTEGGALPLFVEDVIFSPDASLVAVGYRPNQIVVWDVATGSPRDILGTAAEWLRFPVFSPDGQLLAASSSNGRIMLWPVAGISGD